MQDEASQLAAAALARVPLAGADSRWLDLCAGPGGKARLLAGLATGAGARLLAGEVREHRARLVRSAVVPWVITADGKRPAWRAAAFDRVIADVPCSGLGALRRRPEARWRRGPEDVSVLSGLQRDLLHAALAAVRPGGVVAYVNCSPHPAETARWWPPCWPAGTTSLSWTLRPVLAEVPDLRSEADGRYAQFWPHRHGTDAIFLALLARSA